MAAILAVTDGPIGMRFSTIELGRRLVAAGHAVTYAGPESDRALVRHHGLRFRALQGNEIQRFRSEDSAKSLTSRLSRVTERRKAALAATGAARFLPLLEELNPDLVLMDGEMQEHIVVTAGARVPMALLNTFASIWRRPGAPPAHSPIQPGSGWLGSRGTITLAWWGFLLRKRLKFFRLRLRQVGSDRLSLLRALARDAGVDLDRETDANHWLIPFTWPGYPSLSLHALEFEFPHEPAPGVHYVGPMLLEDRLEPPLPQDDRSRLDQLLERHGRSEPGSALLYAGFGSFFTARQGWLERLFAAVARRPGWDLVLSLGGRLQASDLGELPRGVHAFAWAPQLEVLARADAAIVHGGISTVDECVLAGVPMLVVCGGHTDMRGNMARVVHHGIGLAADPARDTPDRILQSLDRLVSEDSFADRLDQMGRAYRRYGTQRVAERVVEELLVDHPGVDLSGSGRS